MGSVRGGPRRPNTTAYFVALAGILILLLLLCCYFIYFCVTKVKELTREDSPLQQPAASSAPPRTSYAVQPVVRESATAMAKLCKQIPAPGKGDTVFPAASSPAATCTDTGDRQANITTDVTTARAVASESAANTQEQGKMAPAPPVVNVVPVSS